ncbi:MAG: hypothetical protein GXP04_02045 [Alphaproteobacteria bacterium]|nr:hypothetical protein [Alphaproteobacteria bacterium]
MGRLHFLLISIACYLVLLQSGAFAQSLDNLGDRRPFCTVRPKEDRPAFENEFNRAVQTAIENERSNPGPLGFPQSAEFLGFRNVEEDTVFKPEFSIGNGLATFDISGNGEVDRRLGFNVQLELCELTFFSEFQELENRVATLEVSPSALQNAIFQSNEDQRDRMNRSSALASALETPRPEFGKSFRVGTSLGIIGGGTAAGFNFSARRNDLDFGAAVAFTKGQVGAKASVGISW